MEKPALLIIDMVKDSFRETENLIITPFAKQIIAPINKLILLFREKGWPIVFATDAFHEEDFIFRSRMKPYSIAGTEGAEVIAELDRREEDIWLPKPRFSAFFKTDLDQQLRKKNVTLCAVAGITTNFCVLTSVMDAICHDFKAVILEDCTAAALGKVHQQTLELYRRNAIYPLLRVVNSSDLIEVLSATEGRAL